MVKDSALSPKKKDWKLSFWLPLKWHQISHLYSFLCLNIIVFVMLLNDIFFFRKTNFLGIAKPKCFTIQSFSQWYGCGILQSSCSIISLQYFHWRGMFVSLYYIGISCALFFNQKHTTLHTLHKLKVYAWRNCKIWNIRKQKDIFILSNLVFVTLMLRFLLMLLFQILNLLKWKK